MPYWQYSAWMKLAENSYHFAKLDPAKRRQYVLAHYYKFGWRSACHAYNIGKSTLYDWKREYEISGKRLRSLVPRSTKPKTTRRMLTDYRLVEFIRYMRQEYGNIGKDKIKIFLDKYAESIGVETIGKTTIGKIIKRRNLYFDTEILKKKRRNKRKRDRVRNCPKIKQPGYLQMDGIIVYADSRKHCFISIIDVYTRYARVTKVPTLSSKQSLICYQEFIRQYTYPIHSVQTDNGSEFLGSFDHHLEQEEIKHIFSYPRSPRVNGYIERFNRTVQEECIYRLEELYWEPESIQTKLDEYLNWYNFKRPHAALNYQAPVTFLLNSIPKCM